MQLYGVGYKWLPSAMSRAVDSHPGKQSSNPAQAFFFFVMGPFYVSIFFIFFCNGSILCVYYTTNLFIRLTH